MADIFISYSKRHRQLTVDLAGDLQALGYSVWWDTDLAPGERFRDVINAELAGARAAIVIWTPSAVKSDWVISEASRAHKRKILIAVHSEDLPLDDIPQPFDVLHTAPIGDRGAITAALAKLGVLPASAGDGENPAPLAPKIVVAQGKPAKPPWRPPRRAVIAAGLVATAGAAAGAVLLAFRPKPPLTPIRTMTDTGAAVSCLAYLPGGREFLCGTWDRAIQRRNAATGEVVLRYDGHRNVVFAIAASPDGSQILSGGDDALVKLWNVKQPHAVTELKGHDKEVQSVVFLKDGGALSAGADGKILMWNLAARTVARTFQHGKEIYALAVAPDGKVVVSSSIDTLQSWSIADAKPIATFDGHKGKVKALATLPNANQVVSGGDDSTIRLWDIATGKEMRRIERKKRGILALAVSPNGRFVLAGAEDNSAELWEISSGKLVQRFGAGSAVEAVAISPDGRTGADGSRDGTIELWDLLAAGAEA